MQKNLRRCLTATVELFSELQHEKGTAGVAESSGPFYGSPNVGTTHLNG